MHGPTDGRTDGQRENSIPTTNKVCGGIMMSAIVRFPHAFKTVTLLFDITHFLA